MKAKPFTDFTLPRDFPKQKVAEHEVLLAFTHDEDAELFRDWLSLYGTRLFGEWREKQKADA